MGVPTFFRWISEKYPKVTQKCIEEEPSQYADGTEMPVDATQPNPNGIEFDNLYLDMNGIIHPCTHPEDGKEPPTMELMFVAIGNHIDRLFRLVRPRKLVYMAIDGIAPRAKMNQQRSRRFRAALEAEEIRADREKVRRSMVSKGLRVSKDDKPAFDSNVITPGTEFMDKLAEYLRFFILDKQTNDPAWATVKVILSDAQSPGEGEHKVMQFVRRQRAEPGHDPNCHHVMYGLDADLIMLGLASHEVRFTVLRDQVLFGKQNRKGGAKTDAVLGPSSGANSEDVPSTGPLSVSKLKPIEMLHVWILREYLEHEFRPESFEGPLSFEYDFERCIDDFVFLCFFVGNDFLPHLPSLSIREGGLELLINLYRKVLPTLPGFLTNDGDLHLDRVGQLMKVLGTVEDRIFQLRRAQEEREKQRKRNVSNALSNNGRGGGNPNDPSVKASMKRPIDITTLPPSYDPDNITPLVSSKKAKAVETPVAPPSSTQNKSAAAALRAQLNGGVEPEPTVEQRSTPDSEEVLEEDESLLLEAEEEELFDDDVSYEERLKVLQQKRNKPEEDVEDMVRFGEEGWKERYYSTKFGKDGADPKFRRTVVESYVRGLGWVLQYYYKGCQSWKWYYEFHYAPFASDLVNLEDIKLEWSESRPFKPFEQLMAVLPSQSADALPEPCRWYMTDEDSEIADFYPKTIEFDPNGKPVRWLWIALLPFIDENRLLKVTERIEEKFDTDAKRRNAMMPDLLFVPKDSTGASRILSVLDKSPPNLLHNWESDQIAILKLKEKKDQKHYQDALDLPAPTTAGDVRGGGSDDIFLSAPEAGGISGFFLPASPEFAVKIGDSVKSPYSKYMSSINSSRAFVCEFRLSPMLPHLSKLCDGVIIPPKVLTNEDLQIRRPRLSGMDVSNLLSNNGGHGRYENNNNFSDSGLERSWGSLEPSRKQYYGGQHSNPFLNSPPPLLPGGPGGNPHPQSYGAPSWQQQQHHHQYNYPAADPYYAQQQHQQPYYPPQHHQASGHQQAPPTSLLLQLQQTLHQHQTQWQQHPPPLISQQQHQQHWQQPYYPQQQHRYSHHQQDQYQHPSSQYDSQQYSQQQRSSTSRYDHRDSGQNRGGYQDNRGGYRDNRGGYQDRRSDRR